MKNFTTVILFLSGLGFYTARAQFSSVASYPGASTDGAFSFVINGIAYVGGGVGHNKMYAYNAAGNTWSLKAWPADGKVRGWSASFAFNNKGYIIGGDTAFGGLLEDVLEYDPAADKWTPKGNFPGGKRDGMFAWVLSNKVFVGGGFDGQYILGDFYSYDPAADQWTPLSPLPQQAVLFPSSFALNNKGYLTMWEGGGFFNELWSFDPQSMQWTQKTSCPGVARGEGVGFAVNGKGYAGLGQTGFNKTYKDIYEYDPQADNWKFVDSFPIRNTGWSTAFVLGNDAYVGLGTSLPDFQFSNKFYRYKFAAGIKDIEERSILLYPNPASEHLYIESNDIAVSGCILSVHDMNGKLICNQQLSPRGKVDIAFLEKGLYLLELNSENKRLFRKFVKE